MGLINHASIVTYGKRVTAVKGLPLLRSVREPDQEPVVEALCPHRSEIAAAASEIGVSRPMFCELMARMWTGRSFRKGTNPDG